MHIVLKRGYVLSERISGSAVKFSYAEPEFFIKEKREKGIVIMDLRGLYKFTLVDYPGHIACIVFTGGCNFRCPYCHNAALVLDPRSQPRVTETEFFNFLKSRKGLLEGVVVSGGEPTIQPDLADFCRRIREEGYLLKLDTNSSNPEVVYKIHRDCGINALGVDFKAPSRRYSELVGNPSPDLGRNVHEMIRFGQLENIELDIRTTVHKSLLSFSDLEEMHAELAVLGSPVWTLQQFNPVEVIEEALPGIATYEDSDLIGMARKLGPEVRVRGLTGRFML